MPGPTMPRSTKRGTEGATVGPVLSNDQKARIRWSSATAGGNGSPLLGVVRERLVPSLTCPKVTTVVGGDEEFADDEEEERGH